jgi:hypothetical protein
MILHARPRYPRFVDQSFEVPDMPKVSKRVLRLATSFAALLLCVVQAGATEVDAGRFISGETLAVPAGAPVVRTDRAATAAATYDGRLHASLARLADARARGAADLAATSGVPARLVEADRVLVEIRFRDAARANDDRVERLGGTLRHARRGGVTEAWLPIDRLGELVADEGVARVWPAMLVQPQAGSETTQGLAQGQVGPWHAAGLDGSGVTVAIIDTFNDTGGEIDDLQDSGDWPESSELTLEKIGSGSFGDFGDPHGNAVLEIAFDIAPGAEYIAYDVLTLGDWIEAIEDAVDQGADVISASLGAPLDGIGDGSALPGSVAEAVEAAADDGVLYVNSAGNSRRQHWGGLFEPSAAPALHDWSGDGQQINYFGPGNGEAWCINDGAPLRGELFWADWDFTTNDYNLLLFEFDGGNWQQIDESTAPQSGLPGQTPQEFINATASSAVSDGCPAGSGVYGWAVERDGALDEPNLQFFSAIELDERVLERSLGFPADSPSAVAVAALNVGDSEQEPYSSQGPILAPGGELPEGEEHPKPDTASFANVDTASYGSGVFNGTSAAAPHVAGMAALLTQRHPAESREQRLLRLEAISGAGANDLGDSGHDIRHGYGRMRFQLETALVVTQQPGDVQVGDAIGPVEVEVRDDEGLAVISGPTSEIEAAIGDDPSGGAATLSGTTTQPVGDGLAGFDDLAIDAVGAGYTLALSAPGPGTVETGGFDVSAGAPAQLAFSVQPGDTDAGQAISPAVVVQVLDEDGNLVIGDDSTQIELALAAGPGGATLSGGGPVTVSDGEASFDSLAIDLTGSGYRLEASDTGGSLASATSAEFDVLPGEPASLRFDVQPGDAEAGQAIAPAIVVQVLDGQGNLVTDDDDTEVLLAIASGPGGATLSGGGPLAVSGGEVSFDSVSIDRAGDDYQLQATDTAGTLEAATSNAFDIAPGPAAALAFAVQPSETPVDDAVSPPVTVQVVDAQGNLVTDDNSTEVTLAVAAGPGSATLSGGGPVTASNGEAVFGSVSLDTVGSFQLEAADAAATLASATSTPFDIIAGEPAALAFVVAPGDNDVDTPIEPTVSVEVLDAGGNRVTWDDSTQVELNLTAGPAATLQGNGPLTVTAGVAEFQDLAIDTPGSGYQLEATDPEAALTPATSAPFEIYVDDIFADRFEAADG